MALISLSGPRLLATAKRYPQSTINKGFLEIVAADAVLGRLVNSSGGARVVLETLARLMRDSVADNQADRMYYLKKLQSYNTVAKALAEQLAEMVEASQDLAAQEKGKEEAEPYNCQSSTTPLSWVPQKVTLPKVL